MSDTQDRPTGEYVVLVDERGEYEDIIVPKEAMLKIAKRSPVGEEEALRGLHELFPHIDWTS